MVLNATFNNISVISWQSVSLVEETGENHQFVRFVVIRGIVDHHCFNLSFS
jgi:hypothetical protein